MIRNMKDKTSNITLYLGEISFKSFAMTFSQVLRTGNASLTGVILMKTNIMMVS